MENTQENKQLQLQTVANLAQLNHEEISKTIVDSILAGEVDPLQVHMFLKRIEKIAELVKTNKDVKEAVTKEEAEEIKTKIEEVGGTVEVK